LSTTAQKSSVTTDQVSRSGTAGTFDRVQATGGEVIQEPMDEIGRDCAFRDPAGNHIRIIQTRG
jgi:predicted enzyme related to lactoylglutathione lyase